MISKRYLLAGIAGLAVVGWLVFGHGAADRPAGPISQPVPVTAAQVVARDVALNLTGIGTVQAYNTVTIRARVDGELVEVAFHEGSDVKKGDVLARIDPRPYQAALDNALATLAKDQAALANARRDLTRYQDTAGKGYSSRQQLDTQTMTVATTEAQIQADQATIENARVQLGYTTITAPLDGVTGIRLIDQGNIIHAGDAGGLVVVTQLQPISAIFTLPQSELPLIAAARAKGTLTAVALDGETELDQGTLALVDNQIDPNTGMVKLKANFPNAGRTLWPGQFVTVRLQVGTVHDGLTVASRVIQRGPKGPFAFVVKPDNTVEMRSIETGQDDRGQTLVTKGLNPGERVVVDGQLRLQPGTAVQATEDKTAAAAPFGEPSAQAR
ncbi:MAG TPA: efflux RND transporter periplasmic adaptor subunit [Alphaproteobacteria bacterium]|jgi:multidrug efflux system membrane fusion protein|nr:efflux RND transporter periplasmic adaptor subunit [Alphaproteobacteria bacterium]